MTIKFDSIPDIGLCIHQIAHEPTIYLDNWAFNKFSNDREIRQRLITTLNDKNGTLAFSIINLVEVIFRRDQDQIEKIKELLDEIDVVLIDVNPHKVIKREKMFDNGVAALSPSADIEFLFSFALGQNFNLELFKASDIISRTLDETEYFRYNFDYYFEKELYPIIAKARLVESVLTNAKKRLTQKCEHTFPCTEQIYSKCIDFIAINQSMKMPEKEWRDIYNLIVPTAYCDYVLADSRWVHFISSLGMEQPYIAKIYNCQKLNAFLDDLENHVFVNA